MEIERKKTKGEVMMRTRPFCLSLVSRIKTFLTQPTSCFKAQDLLHPFSFSPFPNFVLNIVSDAPYPGPVNALLRRHITPGLRADLMQKRKCKRKNLVNELIDM